MNVRSVKLIGYLLLLALWFPGLFKTADHGFSTGETSLSECSARFIQVAANEELETFHLLRFQGGSGTSKAGLQANWGGLAPGHSGLQPRYCTRLSASPPQPTSIYWHVVHATRFPRAPTV